MRIGIIGAGAVGGYFGARLAAGGQEVHLVARGAHGAAIRDGGLRIESPKGDLVMRPASLVERPEDLPALDLVLNCVKLWDLEATGRALASSAAADALVVPLQNGIEAAAILAGILGESRVAQGIAYISAEIAGPGLVRHLGGFASLAFGPRRDEQMPGLTRFLEACRVSGVEARLSDEIAVDLWRKFLMLSALAGATAMRRCTVGELRARPEDWTLLQGLVAEAGAVARAEGVALPAEAEATTLKMLEGMNGEVRASMALDLARGNRLELPWLNGAVLRLAERHGLAVPHSAKVVAALTPYAKGAQ